MNCETILISNLYRLLALSLLSLKQLEHYFLWFRGGYSKTDGQANLRVEIGVECFKDPI